MTITATQPIAQRPLHGVRVLDLSRVLAGPYAGMMLADMGADVIKIENPAHGDDTRTFNMPNLDGHSVYFLTVNRNKKSVALDLKAPEGRDAFLSLVEHSDVVIENFRTGVMERLGLDFETLKERRPGLIMCSISGYGRDGPNTHLPGYDPVTQGESGLMAMTGEPAGQPMRIGISLVDMMTGMYASNAISAALRDREVSGAGRFIEVALHETGLNMLVNFAGSYLITGGEPRRSGNVNQIAQPAGVFEASDGPFTIAIGNNAQFATFCRDVIGRPEFISDARFVDNDTRVANIIAVRETLGAIFAERSRDEWVARLRTAGLPGGVVATVAEALQSELVATRGSVQDVTHSALGSYRAVMTPARMHATEPVDLTGAPLLGEHTRGILQSVAGMNKSTIDALITSGVARAAD